MMIKRILNFQTKSINSAAFFIFLSALLSRILGILRNSLLAGYFGATRELDIYFASFRLPDLLYTIFFGGGISLVFLPIFAEYFQKDKRKAWEISNSLFNILFLILLVCALLIFIFAPSLAKIIAPGFTSQEQVELAKLIKILVLSPILFGASSLLSSLLQYFKRFLIYSLAPILYNLGIIFGILVLSPKFGIKGVVFGVIIGAFIYFVLHLIGAILCGWRWVPKIYKEVQVFKKFLFLLLPRTFSAGIQQINLIFITSFASIFSKGSIAIFNFANDLQMIPIGLVSIPFSVAAFPEFSKLNSQNKEEEFQYKFWITFTKILFFVIPLALFIFLLRAQIVRLILGTLGKRFDWTATRLTAASLGIFSPGIIFASFVPLISRAFFAFKNTKTPAILSFFTVLLNVSLCFLFAFLFSFDNYFSKTIIHILDLQSLKDIRILALPLAFSLASIFQGIMLFYLFLRFKKIKPPSYFKHSIKQIVAIALVASFALFLFLQIFSVLFNTRTVLGLFSQTLLSFSIGALVYFLLAHLCRLTKLFVSSYEKH